MRSSVGSLRLSYVDTYAMFFSHTSKNWSNLIKKKSKNILRGEFDEISVHLKTYHCIHFVGLQACKWSRSKTLWFLDQAPLK